MTGHDKTAIRIEPEPPCRGLVIWLHGLGADQQDLIPLSQQLECCDNARHLFVQAPTRPVSINQGMTMPAWYDLNPEDMSLSAIMRDENGLHESIEHIARIIQAETANGIETENIVIAGFSQGGSIALACALACRDKLGGVICLSGWLVRNPLPGFSSHGSGVENARELVKSEYQSRGTPILVHHGEFDDTVPFQSASITIARLHSLNLEPQWQSFATGHDICAEQIPLIARFIKQALRPVP